MGLFKRGQDYSSVELVSRDLGSLVDAPGTLATIQEPTLGLRRRFLPTIALLFTTCAAVAVWSLHLTHWRDNLGLFTFVTTHRVAVQVIIHVISSALTLLWTFGVCSTINLFTRSHFARRAISIKTLRLWTLISQARISFSIPLNSFLVSAAFCGITILPAWLWTGALTPQLTTFSVPSNITLPKIGTGAYPFLNPRLPGFAVDFECWTTNQANGTFTSCPGLSQSGSLLDSASSATTINGSPRNHSKYDLTEYRYVGRSFGVGASVGLTIDLPTISTLDSYNYTETGYLTTARCIHNSSSLWEISEYSCPDMNTFPCTYFVGGCLPNSNFYPNGSCSTLDGYAQSSFPGVNKSIVAMGATNCDNKTEYYLAVAASDAYKQFKQKQCQFFFKPTVFAVNVSITSATIVVAPLGPGKDPEPRGMLRSKVLDALNTISMVQTTLYTSTVGAALESNFRNYVSYLESKKDDDSTTDSKVLGAMTDSMEAMADDVLESFAAAALTQADAVERREVLFTARGIEIGELPFVIAILVYQILGLIGVVTALLLSKCWYHTPAFDYSDIGTMSTAAHLGANPPDVNLQETVKHWKGEPEDTVLDLLSARYRRSNPQEPPVVQIVLTDGHQSERGSIVYRPL